MSKVFMVAGEVSGDTHGAGLMRELKERHGPIQFLGLGGPQMHAVSDGAVEDWTARAAVLGLWEVLKRYGWFKEKFAQARRTIAQEEPDAVIFIDYPGFNLRLVRALRQSGFAGKLIYYISPQVWAWKKGRVKTMARDLNLMICIFPFEREFYERSGLATVFAGHPMVDRLAAEKHPVPRDPSLVGLFPGSRDHEIARLLPVMLEAALLVRKQVPQARFAISAANQQLRARMLEITKHSATPEAGGWIETGSAHALMQRAEVGVIASGTATLEAACFGLPYVLVYKVNPVTFAVGKAVIRIRHLGIVNILAGETVVEEFVQGRCRPEPLAKLMVEFLLDSGKREALRSRLATVVARLGEGGAYRRAADAVAAELSRSRIVP